MKRKKQIECLEIAIDVLDRAEGTILYNQAKKLSGWSDKAYSESIAMLATMLLKLQQLDELDNMGSEESW